MIWVNFVSKIFSETSPKPEAKSAFDIKNIRNDARNIDNLLSMINQVIYKFQYCLLSLLGVKDVLQGMWDSGVHPLSDGAKAY
jgi:hypothetical protein